MEFGEVGPSHDDLVNDIAFDYYGKRFSTCSSDKHIKIWSLDESKSTNKWTHVDISRAHRDSIWRLSWANPEFGQLLASCSEDGAVCVWEEQESASADSNNSSSSGSGHGGRWVRKVKLSNSKKSVNDVKFSNRSLGIKLAAVSADGFIRIYEAPDVFDLNKWDLVLEYEVADDVKEPTTASGAAKTPAEHGLTCVTWNDSPFESAKIAVGGYSSCGVVYSLERNTLKVECFLGDRKSSVHDIAWAPSMGRSYHMIATASREPFFLVHTLKRRPSGALEVVNTKTITSSSGSNVWRVSWNATGTILATSSDDGALSLWRKNFSGEWVNVQDVPSTIQKKMSYLYKNQN